MADNAKLKRLATQLKLSISGQPSAEELKVAIAKEIDRRLQARGIMKDVTIRYDQDAPQHHRGKEYKVLDTNVTWRESTPRIMLNREGQLFCPLAILEYATVV